MVVSSLEPAYFEAEKPVRENCFIEKLEPGFFDSEKLQVIVGKGNLTSYLYRGEWA